MAQGVKAPATKPFLQKLYTMLEDESAHAIMSWTPNGESIVVHQPEAFAQQLLPLYFKHNNFSSFVRQLNTYGFNKVDPDAWVFGHPDFRQGAKGTLHLIQRKSSHKTAATKTAAAGRDGALLAPFSSLSPGGSHDPAASGEGAGTSDEAALQHELALSRAEHAGIASRITELSDQLQMTRQQQANTRGSIGKIMAFLSQVYHMRGGTSGQVAGPSSAGDFMPGPGMPPVQHRVMQHPAAGIMPGGYPGEELEGEGGGKRRRLAEPGFDDALYDAPEGHPANVAARAAYDGAGNGSAAGDGAACSGAAAAYGAAPGYGGACASSSLAEERLAGVPSLQVDDRCARLQELTSSEGEPNPSRYGGGCSSSSLAEERLAGVPSLQVDTSFGPGGRLQELSPSEGEQLVWPAAAGPFAPQRQLSRGQVAAEVLPPQLHEVALQLVGSTELQDEAIDQIKNAAADKPEPEAENLESFLWDFLEGAQAHADSAQGQSYP